MSQHHPCIGGPLDGLIIAKPDHVKQFRMVRPRQPFTLFDPATASQPVEANIETVTYTLIRNAAGVLEWVAS